MDNEKAIAQLKPFFVELEKGRTYLWCSCGKSQKQPYCDGSHRGSDFRPKKYVAQKEREEVLFCGCKHTQTAPFCDGAHNNLSGEYPSDDPNSAKNRAIPALVRKAGIHTILDGGCFVVAPSTIPASVNGRLRYAPIITNKNGARYQSQYFVGVEPGVSPIMGFDDSHVVGFVTQGDAGLSISGREYHIDKHAGFVIHPNEVFQFENTGSEELQLFLNVCPILEQPTFHENMLANFNDRYGDRVARIDQDNKSAMADRFFQVLIDKRMGCDTATQFIGEVPQSKAAVHRHLYEESLIVLSGKGTMWTDSKKTSVETGDVIFLPQKQEHSLQCTDPEGMLLLGVIYPGDNPSINY